MNAASWLWGGFVYALVVFAIGFIVGAIRVRFVVPRVGATTAVAMETPIMLVASWLACSWSIARFHILSELASRTLMGIVALAVLLMLELGLSAALFHRSLAQFLAAYRTAPGPIGLGAQFVFAALPVAQAFW